MIHVGAPVIAGSGDQLTLRCSLKAPTWVGLRRDELVLTLPSGYGPLQNLGEVAVMSLLPYAFWAGASIRLADSLTMDGSVGDNVARLCQLWGQWFRRPFNLQVVGGGTSSAVVGDEGTTALLFSGGVDSMSAYLRHKSAINSFTFVRGSDLNLRDDRLDVGEKYRTIISPLKKFAEEQGKEFLEVSTNVRHVFGFRFGGTIWNRVALVCCTVAPLLALSGRFSRLMMASDGLGPYELSLPGGLNPHLFPLIGAGRMVVNLVDVGWSRHAKVCSIAREPRALSVLRVCSQEVPGYNCGQCLKCCVTIASLLTAGVKAGQAPFPPGTFSFEHVHNRLKDLKLSRRTVSIIWSELVTALRASEDISPAGYRLAEAIAQKLGPAYERYCRGELPVPATTPCADLPQRPNVIHRLIGYPSLSQPSFAKWVKNTARASFGKQRIRTRLAGVARPKGKPMASHG